MFARPKHYTNRAHSSLSQKTELIRDPCEFRINVFECRHGLSMHTKLTQCFSLQDLVLSMIIFQQANQMLEVFVKVNRL